MTISATPSFFLQRIAGMLLILLFNEVANGQTPIHVNVTAVNGATQSASVGQPFRHPFIARVTFDDGTPVVGVPVNFEVNGCLVFSSSTYQCPPVELYGHFENGTYDHPEITDASGLATSSAFTAGTEVGEYQIYALVDIDATVNGQKVTNFPSLGNEFFSVRQVAAASTAQLPVLSAWALSFLVALLLCAALSDGGVRGALDSRSARR